MSVQTNDNENRYAILWLRETARVYSATRGERITFHQVILAERRAFKILREALAAFDPELARDN